jgi:ATP-dependent DNA helicase RecG
MKKVLKRLKNLLNLLVEENFKYFNRVKDPHIALRALLVELKDYLDPTRKEWVSRILKHLDGFAEMDEEDRKKLIREIHSTITLEFTEESIKKAIVTQIPQERITTTVEKLKIKKEYPIKAFFQSVEKVKGITEKRAERLKKLGVEKVIDALFYLPYRYEDRSTVTPMGHIVPGEHFLVKGRVISVQTSRTFRRKKGILKAVLYDKTGSVTLVFLQEKVFGYYRSLFSKAKALNREVLAYGTVKRDYGGFSMVHPEVEIVDPYKGKLEKFGAVLPVYRSCEGINPKTVRRDIQFIVKKTVPYMREYMPKEVLDRLNLPQIHSALWSVHFPDSEDLEGLSSFKTPGQRRVIFDELFLLQLALAIHRQKVKKQSGIAFKVSHEMVEEFKGALPFKLTSAQERVLREIIGDMEKPEPMNRLLQGDVGSGKTVIAIATAFFAGRNGYQTAVMAPTEILASQHLFRFKELLNPLNIRVGLLTGSMTKREKETMHRAIRQGYIQVVVGTHALIQEGVEFKNLGLAIIDEQHRFGVRQRLSLRKKGKMPDVLVMTATPIPRTLAMTAYGDLDVSTIDQLPSGRKKIETKIVFEDERESLLDFLKEELGKGNGVYIVYPLIEESEKLELKAATEMFNYWKEKLKPHKVALLHGRMKQEEKEEVMEGFRSGEFSVLVSTTVVEVGVDVPGATVMVVEHPERFGLAQLHQLRGRVGRSDRQSYCFLVAPRRIGEDAIKRLKVLESTTDGFKIAEADLAFRGPGEMFGTRQSGFGDLRVADLRRDYELLATARDIARELVEKNPELTGLEDLKDFLLLRFGEKFELVEAG